MTKLQIREETKMSEEKIESLCDLLKNATVDGIKTAAIVYPSYAGIMSEIHDIGFYHSLAENWIVLVGIGTHQIIKKAYHFEKNLSERKNEMN